MAEGILKIRKGRKTDIPFISNSWVKSFRNGAFVRGIPNELYYRYHRRIVSELLQKSLVAVLCERQDEDQIVGYVVAERSEEGALLVHYVYVKHDFRKTGFAKSMIDMLIEAENPIAVFYTHKTFPVLQYRDKYKAEKRLDYWPMREWIYNPYLLFARLSYTWSTGV
jgi:hypothetical protein